MPGGRGKICQVTITQRDVKTQTVIRHPCVWRLGPRDTKRCITTQHCPPGPLKNEKQWTLVLTRAAPAVLSVEFTSSRRDQGR